MTGYFARLAARSGIGGDGAPPPRRAASCPPFVEETAAAPARPERPDAPQGAAPRPAVRLGPAPMPPAPAAAPPAAAPRFGLPEPPPSPEAGRETGRDPIPPRRADAVRPAVDERPGGDAEAPAATPFSRSATGPRSATADAAAPAQARPGRTTIAVAPAAPTARAADPPAPPAFGQAPPAEAARAATAPATATAPAPARIEAGAGTALPAPSGRTPAFLPEAEEPHHRAPQREPALPRRPGGAARREPAAGPSVRIGSIRLEVHGAPSSPPPAPSAPPPRGPTLRRFYVRDW